MSSRPATSYRSFSLFFFFFQAEDGIRDVAVTGVQTCALPISHPGVVRRPDRLWAHRDGAHGDDHPLRGLGGAAGGGGRAAPPPRGRGGGRLLKGGPPPPPGGGGGGGGGAESTSRRLTGAPPAG